MLSQACIFCLIIKKEISAEIIQESDKILVIKDISPKAPIHFLIIPKEHVADLQALNEINISITKDLFLMAQHLGNSLSDTKSFRLIINNGPEAGQSVLHLHIHFLSGKIMSDF